MQKKFSCVENGMKKVDNKIETETIIILKTTCPYWEEEKEHRDVNGEESNFEIECEKCDKKYKTSWCIY